MGAVVGYVNRNGGGEFDRTVADVLSFESSGRTNTWWLQNLNLLEGGIERIDFFGRYREVTQFKLDLDEGSSNGFDDVRDVYGLSV